MAIIPGRAAHLTRDYDTKPSIAAVREGCPEEVTIMLGAEDGKEPALGKLVSYLVPGWKLLVFCSSLCSQSGLVPDT